MVCGLFVFGRKKKLELRTQRAQRRETQEDRLKPVLLGERRDGNVVCYGAGGGVGL
jgi:hypothetical protein